MKLPRRVRAFSRGIELPNRLERAKDIHGMLSTLIRRNPQHLFSPRRVLALTRLRLQNRVVDHPAISNAPRI
jgi:hypothetical protein